MTKTPKLLFFCVLAASCSVSLFGCCNKYKIEIANQKDEINGLQINLAELEQKNADLVLESASLEQKVDELDAKNNELHLQVASLIEYNQKLSAEIEKLGGDKNKLAANYTSAQQDLEKSKKLLEELRKKQAMDQKRLAVLKNILSKFKKLIEGGKLKIKIKNGKMVLEMPSAILFNSGKAKVSEEGLNTLGEVAGVLSEITNREFQVAGYTDNVPTSSSSKFATNWELSAARAVSVVKALQEMGVKANSLSAAGYSEYQPAASNDSEEGRAENRRIDIVIMPNLDELPDLSQLEKEI